MSMLPGIDKMVIPQGSPLKDAIRAIDENAQGIVFAVDVDGSLSGVLTDGDIRRSFLKGCSLDTPVGDVMRVDFVSMPLDTPEEELMGLLSDRIRHIPLRDEHRRPVDYACRHRLRRIPVMEPVLAGNELAYVTDCIKSGWISSQGSYVQKFEKMFSVLMSGRESVAVCNGTVALHLALLSLGVGPGDEVIVPDLTFAATINSVLHAGATPVIVDVEPGTWAISPEGIEAAITSKTKAVLVVHLYGHPADMDKVMAVARRHGLFVVEDCAEAIGARYRGVPVGTIGDAGCFSFFGNKTVTTGEGGMVVLKQPAHAERARLLRDHGMSRDRKYWHTAVGYNYRMTNMQAAIGVAQLEVLPDILDRKLRLAGAYNRLLSGCGGTTLPPKMAWADPACWLYTITIDEEVYGPRDEVVGKLLLNGIETRPVFYPLHEMPPYAGYAGVREFPVSVGISRAGLSLPSSVSVSEKEAEEIACALLDIGKVHCMVSDGRPGGAGGR